MAELSEHPVDRFISLKSLRKGFFLNLIKLWRLMSRPVVDCFIGDSLVNRSMLRRLCHKVTIEGLEVLGLKSVKRGVYRHLSYYII